MRLGNASLLARLRRAVLCVVFTSGYAAALEKHWLPDLQWETAANWVNGRVPDIDSRVIFPQQTRHAVGIAGHDIHVRLSGLELPRQGLLVLPKNGRVQLSDSRADAGISTWSKAGNYFWSDPANWNGSSIAAPHLDRVPCRQDDVVLPNVNRTLSVLLPVREIEVKSVRLSSEEQPFIRWQWEDFGDRREFSRGEFTVRYTKYSCAECFCQRGTQADYLEEICAIQRPRCGFIGCEYPLTVEGHCCPYCGGRVFTSQKKVSLAMVRSTADEALERYADKFAWHARRRWNGGVEVLVKEIGDYSGVAIDDVVDNLKQMLQNAGIDVSTETAGAAMKDSRLTVALGPFFGAPLVVIALLLLAFLHFGYSLRNVLSGCMEVVLSVRDGIRADKPKHGFARFENVPEGNVQIADVPGTSGQEANDRGITQPTGGRFENPLYRSKKDRSEKREMVDTSLSLTALKDKMDGPENVEMDTEE